MESEIRKLRAALARRQSGRGRRFSGGASAEDHGCGSPATRGRKELGGDRKELELQTETVRQLSEADAPGCAAVEVVASSTTRRRNSGSYGGLLFGIVGSLCHSGTGSTKTGSTLLTVANWLLPCCEGPGRVE